MKTIMMKILINVLPLIVSNITPAIRQELIVFVKKLKELAAKTTNPFDDVLVDILMHVLDIPEDK